MLTYHDILAAVAIRSNSLGNNGLWNATTAAGLQTVYEQRPLIDEMFGSSIFSFNALRDAIIACEGKIATTVGHSANRSLRAYIRALSAPLASGDALPVDAGGKKVVGNFSEYNAVVDGVDNTIVCTPQPIPVVRNRLLAPNNFLVPAYQFAYDGATIIHTRTTVLLECSVYSASDQTEAFNFDNEILFPDALAEVYLNGSMALLVRDDEWIQQSQVYGSYFQAFLATLPPVNLAQAA